MADGKAYPEQFRGWLLKWTNYIKGYQRRWFVLSNGLLSYYRWGINKIWQTRCDEPRRVHMLQSMEHVRAHMTVIRM